MDDRTTDDCVDLTRPPSAEVLAAQIELTIAADARAALASGSASAAHAHAGRRTHDPRG
jgi:hypothetical protein